MLAFWAFVPDAHKAAELKALCIVQARPGAGALPLLAAPQPPTSRRQTACCRWTAAALSQVAAPWPAAGASGSAPPPSSRTGEHLQAVQALHLSPLLARDSFCLIPPRLPLQNAPLLLPLRMQARRETRHPE